MGSRIFIYHVSGAKQGEIEVCTSNVVRIGRQPGCEVQVDPYADLYASGHHAQITWVGGEQFTLADTGSKLGTFKNDLKVVDPVAITTGDVITLGRDRQGRTGPQLRFYLDRDILKCPGCQDPVYKRHFTCPSCTQKFCLRCIDFRQKTCKPCGQRPQAMPAAPGFPPPPPGRDPFGPVGSNSEPELRIPDLAVYTSANPPAPPGTRPPDASGSGRLGPGSARLAQAAQPHSGDSARLERSGSGRMASSGSNAFPRPQVPQAPGSDRFPGASPGPTPSGYVPTISSTARAPQPPRPPSPPTDDDAASIFSDSVDGGDDSFEAEAPPAIPCERCSAPLSAADFFVCATCHKRLCPKHHHGGESCDRCLAVDQSLLETDDNPPPAWAGPRPPMPPQAPAVPLPVGAGSELTGVDFECPGCGIALAPKAETCPGCWRKLK